LADTLLSGTLTVILACLCAIGLLSRIGFPAAVGYLLAGLVIGPHGLQFLAATDGTKFLAELGVIFLMFMVGLEFSLPTIIAARADVFGAGGLQVAATCLAVAAGVMLFDASWPVALLLGSAAAMSSTAIALKQLADQGEISSEHGRRAVGILLFQDLATLPLLVIISALGQAGGPSALRALFQVVVAAGALAMIALAARPIFRLALTWVARSKSPDLFLLCVLLLALGTAFAAHLVGLSPPIGAFLAGMVVAESDFRHAIEDDIRPFRDVLLGLFFVTIGMGIDPAVITLAPLAVLTWMIVFLPGKAILMFLLAVIMRWPTETAIRVAVVLAHGGEFGLLLLSQSVSAGLVMQEVAQPALLALVLSMAVAPVLIHHNASIARLIAAAPREDAVAAAVEHAVREESRHLNDHVLLCGCGRIGQLTATVFAAAKVPYIAVEADLTRFREAQKRGHKVVFGDASRGRILQAAGLTRAQLLVVTFDRRSAVERLLHYARHQNPGVPAIVSTDDDRDLSTFASAGAASVFPENHAAGLALGAQALLFAGFSQDEAARVIAAVRAELNPELLDRVGL
jgi:CPA2 family monovalent cation:H+ antiporter-2